MIAQNGGPTRLFQNRLADPGIRIRVQGPPANPHAVGARLRWLNTRTGEATGPMREIQAGSGYWSQNSPVQVMRRPAGAHAMLVVWPDGTERRVVIPESSREMVLSR